MEFNPVRVRTHFIHTVLRLELENKQHQSDEHVFNNIDVGDGGQSWHPNMCGGLSTVTTTHTNYNNSVIYNNNSSLQQPDLSMVVDGSGNSHTHVIGTESLDLHYAYRDDYVANAADSLIIDPIVANNGVPLYGHHDGHAMYDSSYPTFSDSGHSQNHQYDNYSDVTTPELPLQPQILENDNLKMPSYSNHLKEDTDLQPIVAELLGENLDLSTNAASLECKNDGFVNLLSPAADSSRIDAINDLLENSRHSIIPAPPASSTSVSTLLLPSSSTTTPFINNNNDTQDESPTPLSTITSSSSKLCTNDNKTLNRIDDNEYSSCKQSLDNNCTHNNVDEKLIEKDISKPIEMDDNLCEIIKNSIVETVST